MLDLVGGDLAKRADPSPARNWHAMPSRSTTSKLIGPISKERGAPALSLTSIEDAAVVEDVDGEPITCAAVDSVPQTGAFASLHRHDIVLAAIVDGDIVDGTMVNLSDARAATRAISSASSVTLLLVRNPVLASAMVLRWLRTTAASAR